MPKFGTIQSRGLSSSMTNSFYHRESKSEAAKITNHLILNTLKNENSEYHFRFHELYVNWLLISQLYHIIKKDL